MEQNLLCMLRKWMQCTEDQVDPWASNTEVMGGMEITDGGIEMTAVGRRMNSNIMEIMERMEMKEMGGMKVNSCER